MKQEDANEPVLPGIKETFDFLVLYLSLFFLQFIIYTCIIGSDQGNVMINTLFSTNIDIMEE